MLSARQAIWQSVRLVRPPLPYATGECHEIHKPSDYPQAEIVQYLVRVVYPPAGLCDLEAPSIGE
jgi:hypothetical protein